MPFVFRKLNRQTNWLDDKTGKLFDFDWLRGDDFPADPLVDFSTKHGALSVYILGNDSKELVERVASAIAATAQSLSNVDYALIELDQLNSLGFKTLIKSGTTPDEVVNSLHCDLIELSGNSLVKLVALFWRHQNLVIRRIQEKTIHQQIVVGVKQGYVDRSKIKITTSKLLDALDAI